MAQEDNKNSALKHLHHELLAAVITNYGRPPSAATFAEDFNLRAIGTTTVPRETTIKWLNGTVFPCVGHLVVLVSWLNLLPDAIFGKLEKRVI